MGIVPAHGCLRLRRVVDVKTRRFSRGDWLDLGLDAVSAQGPAGVTIDALCRRAAKTKGAFYAHFETIDAYLEALLGLWRERHTDRLAAPVGPDPIGQLAALDKVVAGLDVGIEQGMRQLAGRSATLAELCRSVDQARIGFLAALHEAGGRTAPDALALARFEYAAYLGFQQLHLGLDAEETCRIYEVFLDAVAARRSAEGEGS